mmetsp:Transcript_17231/g.24891  ORF Transcript_17231/g.24891 Transcript_17231/m.24891 type:complete len:204 (+) Transcript_17231:12-623(+)
MAQALPLTKLAGLLIKTFAKPLSRRVKHDFSRYKLGQRILIGIGQSSHQVSSRLTIWSSGYRVRSIPPLEESEAMRTGAEFVGESVVLLVSSGIVIWEYNRSQRSARDKSEAKRAQAQAERDALTAKLLALDTRLQALEKVVAKNSDSILNFGQKYKSPSKETIVPIVTESELKEFQKRQNIVEEEKKEKPKPVRRKWGIFGR